MEGISIFAPDQDWNEDFLRQIKRETMVIYDGRSAHAIKIHPRANQNPLFEILGADDGQLFSYNQNVKFDLYWTDGLIKTLEEAKRYWELLKKINIDGEDNMDDDNDTIKS